MSELPLNQMNQKTMSLCPTPLREYHRQIQRFSPLTMTFSGSIYRLNRLLLLRRRRLSLRTCKTSHLATAAFAEERSQRQNRSMRHLQRRHSSKIVYVSRPRMQPLLLSNLPRGPRPKRDSRRVVVPTTLLQAGTRPRRGLPPDPIRAWCSFSPQGSRVWYTSSKPGILSISGLLRLPWIDGRAQLEPFIGLDLHGMRDRALSSL